MTYDLPTHPRVTAPRTLLLQNLSTQTQQLTQLFTHLSNPSSSSSSSAHPINQIYSSLQSSTDELARIVLEVASHQAAYRELERQKREVIGLERQVRLIVHELEKGRSELESMVTEGREARKSIENVTLEPSPVQPLLAHARSLARTSSAPISSLLAPVERVGDEPWPNEMAMRMGLLFRLEGSMSGTGDVGTIGDERAVKAEAMEPEREVHREEPGRRYDPNAVFQLELNSDESDDD